VGTGFDNQMLIDLRATLDAIEIDKPPFTKAVGLPRIRAHWVRPKIVVQVAFTEWTVYGKLRHPRLLGIRIDKSPREVVREQPCLLTRRKCFSLRTESQRASWPRTTKRSHR